MNFHMGKGRLTKTVRRTINDAQRPPQPFHWWFDCGNLVDLTGPTNSILPGEWNQILAFFRDWSQKSCAHGLTGGDQESGRQVLCVRSTHPRFDFVFVYWHLLLVIPVFFFGFWCKFFLNFPWILCCVLISRSHSQYGSEISDWNWRFWKSFVLEIAFFLEILLGLVVLYGVFRANFLG